MATCADRQRGALGHIPKQVHLQSTLRDVYTRLLEVRQLSAIVDHLELVPHPVSMRSSMTVWTEELDVRSSVPSTNLARYYTMVMAPPSPMTRMTDFVAAKFSLSHMVEFTLNAQSVWVSKVRVKLLYLYVLHMYRLRQVLSKPTLSAGCTYI